MQIPIVTYLPCGRLQIEGESHVLLRRCWPRVRKFVSYSSAANPARPKGKTEKRESRGPGVGTGARPFPKLLKSVCDPSISIGTRMYQGLLGALA
jgi:hypothetical protein